MDRAAVVGMRGVAKYHREHERFHSMAGLEQAAGLRRDANALKVLADRWLSPSSDGQSGQINVADARYSAAGCPDLNDTAAVATTGLLFMEGETEPAEITALKAKLHSLASGLQTTSKWLGEKMDAGWEREQVLLHPQLLEAAFPRFMVLTRTSLSAASFGVAARLIDSASRLLASQTFSPPAIRSDRSAMAKILLHSSWLLDRAAALLAEQAAELSLSDPDWTAYLAELATISEDADA